jgi:uncharacterized membrane protein YgdD (TMEM256/DUF423 family)
MPMGRRGRLIFAAAAVLAAADVGLRAWQAHGLSTQLDPEGLHLFDTARGHQFGIALGLFLTAIRMSLGGGRLATWAAATFAVGGSLFCADVYQAAFAADHAAFGVAPFGGTLTIVAWLLLAADAASGAGTQI